MPWGGTLPDGTILEGSPIVFRVVDLVCSSDGCSTWRKVFCIVAIVLANPFVVTIWEFPIIKASEIPLCSALPVITIINNDVACLQHMAQTKLKFPIRCVCEEA